MITRDTSIVQLPLYEPSGGLITLSLDDLTRHLVLFGSTGAGKTVVLNQILHQLLRWQNSAKHLRPGLVILDGKADDTIDKVCTWAAEFDRTEDLTIVAEDTDAFVELVDELHDLSDVEPLCQMLNSVLLPMSEENAFWEQQRFSLLRAAVTLMLFSKSRNEFNSISRFLTQTILHQCLDATAMGKLQDIANSAHLSKSQRQQLLTTLDVLEHWTSLDSRTRSIVQSTLTPLMSVFTSSISTAYCAGIPEQGFRISEVNNRGAILVVSIDANAHETLAAFIFKSIKRKLFGELQRRQSWQPNTDRLAILICDELPLLISGDDWRNIGVCRSKGGCLIAASQGLSSLDQQIGYSRRNAFLLNINSQIFLRSTELELESHASRILGTRRIPRRDEIVIETHTSTKTNRSKTVFTNWCEESVCPAGALARLETLQGFVSVAGDSEFENPVWLAPKFHEPAQNADALRETRIRQSCFLSAFSGAAHAHYTDRLMDSVMMNPIPGQEGQLHSILSPPESTESDAVTNRLFPALQRLCSSKPSKESLASIPTRWIPAISEILLNWDPSEVESIVPLHILHLGCTRWRIVIITRSDEFPPPFDSAPSVLDQLRIRINRSVFPSIYRPLRPKDRLQATRSCSNPT